jgi:hypothetical protein
MWAQMMVAALGVWLMVAPDMLGFGKTIADNDHIVGPIIVTFAITAIFENTRNVRLFNIPPGLWLLLAPWILQYQTPAAIINDMVVGGGVIGCSLIKGQLKNRFAGGWRSLFKTTPRQWEEKHSG